MSRFKQAKRIVIKVGSSSLTHATGRINIRQMEKLCKILSDIKNSGREVVLVSSGAVAVGTGKLGLAERPQIIREKQAVAAVGQCELMYLYDKYFSEYHHHVGQILLTGDVIEHPDSKQNVVNTFETLLSMGVIPIVNENDTVSCEELEALSNIGDNDTLSAIVATLINADGLIILSDIDGLYEQNPQLYPDAKLIPRVTHIDSRIEAIAGGAGSALGTGGMATKVKAARMMLENNAAMAIVNSENLEVLYDLLEGHPVGTLFARED